MRGDRVGGVRFVCATGHWEGGRRVAIYPRFFAAANLNPLLIYLCFFFLFFSFLEVDLAVVVFELAFAVAHPHGHWGGEEEEEERDRVWSGRAMLTAGLTVCVTRSGSPVLENQALVMLGVVVEGRPGRGGGRNGVWVV